MTNSNNGVTPSAEDIQRADEWIKQCTDFFAANPDAMKYAESCMCPPEPSPDEQSAANDPDFIASCHADVAKVSKGPVVIDGQLLTRSPTFGLVWRADVWNSERKDQLSPLRVACWKKDNGELGMTISGQAHPKLALKT
jgi:hypothetical protein